MVPNGNAVAGYRRPRRLSGADDPGRLRRTASGAGHNPIGVTFIGTAFSEAKLLADAYALEQATNVRLAPSFTNPSMWRCVPGSTFFTGELCNPGDRLLNPRRPRRRRRRRPTPDADADRYADGDRRTPTTERRPTHRRRRRRTRRRRPRPTRRRQRRRRRRRTRRRRPDTAVPPTGTATRTQTVPATPTQTPTSRPCLGDIDGDGHISGNDVAAVARALNTVPRTAALESGGRPESRRGRRPRG